MDDVTPVALGCPPPPPLKNIFSSVQARQLNCGSPLANNKHAKFHRGPLNFIPPEASESW